MRCPVCKADNVAGEKGTGPLVLGVQSPFLRPEGQVCRRCKADLSLLFDVERRREWCLGEARRCLRDGNSADALNLALRAAGLHGDAESRRLVAIASLLSGNFEQALRYHAGPTPEP
jgi:hypothetical protein